MMTTALDRERADGGARLAPRLPLSFELDAAHEAHEPPEARGVARDGVRLLVSRGLQTPEHTTFGAFPELLEPGDLVVVNTSGTVGAALDATDGRGAPLVVHVSNELPGRLWMVEPRARIANGSTRPHPGPVNGPLHFADGTALDLLRPVPGSRRLWLAMVDDDTCVEDVMERLGRPIRYSYVDRDWPLREYQTVFVTEAGSAEMPSAARPFTADIVTRLVRLGVQLAPITLHTGVSSLEGNELPYPERFNVSEGTARAINATHAAGNHVIAVGTTVVRALETATDTHGATHPASGWTDTVITPARGVRAVDGLLTGWHEPEATHLAMLEAVACREPLVDAYEAAFAAGYQWHEFGDSHLLLPYIA